MIKDTVNKRVIKTKADLKFSINVNRNDIILLNNNTAFYSVEKYAKENTIHEIIGSYIKQGKIHISIINKIYKSKHITGVVKPYDKEYKYWSSFISKLHDKKYTSDAKYRLYCDKYVKSLHSKIKVIKGGSSFDTVAIYIINQLDNNPKNDTKPILASYGIVFNDNDISIHILRFILCLLCNSLSKANITQLCFEFTESLLNFFKQTQPQSIDQFFGKLQEILPCIHKFNAIFDQIRINYIQGNIEEFANKITEFSSGIHAELSKHIDKVGQNIQQFGQDSLQKVDQVGQNIQQFGQDSLQKVDQVGQNIQQFGQDSLQKVDQVGQNIQQFGQDTLQKIDEAGKHIQQLQDEVKQNIEKMKKQSEELLKNLNKFIRWGGKGKRYRMKHGGLAQDAFYDNPISMSIIMNYYKVKTLKIEEFKDTITKSADPALNTLYICKYLINFLFKAIFEIHKDENIYNTLDFIDTLLSLFIGIYMSGMQGINTKLLNILDDIIPKNEAGMVVHNFIAKVLNLDNGAMCMR
jgi:methyl-accepting chemotaxis protein